MAEGAESEKEHTNARPPGRPRDVAIDELVLRATIDLLVERGIDGDDDPGRLRAHRHRPGDDLPALAGSNIADPGRTPVGDQAPADGGQRRHRHRSPARGRSKLA